MSPAQVVYEGQDFTEDEARKITAEIKAWAGTLWVKLKHAHDGKAWKALGYSTWVDYLSGEFDIAKSQGYRLLAHARTMDQLADAAGLHDVSPMGDIPERVMRGLDADSVADDVAEKAHDLPHDATDADRARIVTETVEEHRTTTTETTEFDPATGEILGESSAQPPSPPAAADTPDADPPAASGASLSAAPEPPPAPEFATVGDLIDWCPDSGQWLAYQEMQRTESTRQFAGVMNRRLPRDADQDIAELCPPEALRSAIFAAEVAATYWTDLAADLRRRQHPTTNRPHLAAVEG